MRRGANYLYRMKAAKSPRVDPLVRAWVETWREAAVALRQVKRAELARVDTPKALRQLGDAFRDAARLPRTATTGLVEQQRIFQRLRV